MSLNFDIVIIGSGPGGYVAAIRSAQLGFRTAIIEKSELGGVCLNWGCIPTKALLKSAEVFEELKNAREYGLKNCTAEVDFTAVIQRSRKVAELNSKGIGFLMNKHKIEIIPGNASFKDKSTLLVRNENGPEQEITAAHIIIASGARPRSLPGLAFDGHKIISSREAMSLREQPASMIIIGAGAIGVEFAWFYNSIGTQVTIVEMLDQLLPVEDAEISAILERSFKKAKIKMHLSTKVEEVHLTDQGVEIELNRDGKKEQISASKVLVAIGVQGNVEQLNLEQAGVKQERGFIPVDQWYQTNVPGIYAIGDIIGPPLLAHVASDEGIVCVEKIGGQETHPVDYQSVPGCTYCQPQVASIGLTEKKAVEAGYEPEIGRFPYSASGKARAIGAREGLVKLIFDKKYGELLGAHIIGAEATELIGELGMAKALEATPEAIRRTMHAHPTLSEMIMEAAGEAKGQAIHI